MLGDVQRHKHRVAVNNGLILSYIVAKRVMVPNSCIPSEAHIFDFPGHQSNLEWPSGLNECLRMCVLECHPV